MHVIVDLAVMGGVERLSNFLAVLACLLFCVTLPPTRLTPVVFAPATPELPESSERSGPVVVHVSGLAVAVDSACLKPEPPLAVACPAEPLAGATVRVFWQAEGSYFPVAPETTGPTGQATLNHLPQGQQWLVVEATGFARRALPLWVSTEAQQVLALLERAHELQVSVVDEEQAPIAQATVLVLGQDPLPFGSLTDATGLSVVRRLGAAPWKVTVAARGYERVTHSDISNNLKVTLRKLGALHVTVVDEAQVPVAGAQVFVGGLLWPPQQGTTDERGELQIKGLESGSYDLRAVHGARVSRSVLGLFLQRGETERAQLVLGPGRFVSVRVLDGEGEGALPVADADVVLVEQGIAPFPLQGRSNKEGVVQLGPIALGPATVGAYAEGFIGRAAVPVPEDLEGPLNVALRRGATVRGEVVDQHDHAISGAQIEVIGTDLDGLPVAETPWFSAMRRAHFAAALEPARPLLAMGELGVMQGPIPGIPQLPSVGANLIPIEPLEPVSMGSPWISDLGGEFRLFPVTPGLVRLLVRHPEYVETVSEGITLAPGGEAKVKVVMLQGATLYGRVLDEGGFPVAQARLEVTALRGITRHSRFTAEDGSFEFRAVPSSLVLSLARPGNPVEFVLRKNLDLGQEERRELDVVLPAERGPVEVTVSAERHAVDLALVQFISLDAEVPLKKTVFTDPNGRAEVPDAAGLPLRIVIEAPGFTPYQQTFEQGPATLEVELQRGVVVAGKITAIRGRQAVEGAVITALALGQRHSTRSNALGEFELRDLTPGEVTLTVSHPEYASHERKIRVETTGRADRSFDIEPIDLALGGSVQGVVSDEEGNPVSGARVALGVVPTFLPAGEVPVGMVRTNERGEFELLRLEPGSVTVQAHAVGKGRGSVTAEVGEGLVTQGVHIVVQGGVDTETGQTGGVAITLGEPVPGQVAVVQVAINSEAERAGLQVGDRLIAVEGAPVTAMSDARARLSGSPGTDVLIELQRAESIFKLRVGRELLRR